MNIVKDVEDLIEFAKKRKNIVGLLVDKLAKGQLPYRVTHNDTKFNNLLLDDETFNPVAVIDFDTIMKGTICYDFGDAIRAGCNSAEEDEADLSKVYFDFEKYEAFAKGYLRTLGQYITEEEKDNLAFSCILITFECGIRFLTDYLQGDCYFKTHYDKQNVNRTRTQFKLVADMEERFEEMKQVVRSATC
jgi:thiamine kinase-like enzyme